MKKYKKQQNSIKCATTGTMIERNRVRGFSTKIHIRQNDIGEYGKSRQISIQKIVIFPTCILQIVRRKSERVEPECGKPGGKCLIPQPKWALKLDFCTFSTGFSTCGKIKALLQGVYRLFVENFLQWAKQRDICPAGGQS